MENNRGQSIFLSVVGIATLLVAIIGATFAYFSITVSGNETAQSVEITTAKLGNVTFDATGAGISITNVYPGWSESKTFTIQAASADATATIDYIVNLVVAAPGANETLLQGTDFVYTLTSTDTDSSVPQSNPTETQMPGQGTNVLATGILNGTETASYTFNVAFKETNTNQNAQQGKVYRAVVQVVVSTTDGLRTWDTVNGGWSEYNAANATDLN